MHLASISWVDFGTSPLKCENSEMGYWIYLLINLVKRVWGGGRGGGVNAHDCVWHWAKLVVHLWSTQRLYICFWKPSASSLWCYLSKLTEVCAECMHRRLTDSNLAGTQEIDFSKMASSAKHQDVGRQKVATFRSWSKSTICSLEMRKKYSNTQLHRSGQQVLLHGVSF